MRGSKPAQPGHEDAAAPTAALASTIAGFLAVSSVHLTAQLVGPRWAADLTQVLLMPLLAAALLWATVAPRGRLVLLMLVGLGFSWLGDSVPRLLEGDTGFLAMLGGFLIAQVLYAVAFWPFRRRSLLRRPAVALLYLAVAAAIVALCAPGAGALLPAVVVYAVAIALMAVLATGLGVVAGIGAAVFVLSDALIALNAFGVLTLPGHGFWVMLTYLGAQTMLVRAVHQEASSGGCGGLSACGRPRDPRGPARVRGAWPPSRRGPAPPRRR